MPVIHKCFSRDEYRVRLRVDSPQMGMRLDRYVQMFLSEFSREKVKEKIRQGDVSIKGRLLPFKYAGRTRGYCGSGRSQYVP